MEMGVVGMTQMQIIENTSQKDISGTTAITSTLQNLMHRSCVQSVEEVFSMQECVQTPMLTLIQTKTVMDALQGCIPQCMTSI